MAEQTLASLEEAQNRANQAFMIQHDRKTAADERKAAAKQAYDQAMAIANGSGYAPTEEQMAAVEAAAKELKAAGEWSERVDAAYEDAAERANDASKAVEDKKNEIREARTEDTSFVVCMARLECTCGMRESYILLDEDHGVYTRQIPQMTVKDSIPDTNVVNFGGCKSMENPTTIAAAEAAVTAANAAIQAERERMGWLTEIINIFTRNQNTEVNVDESFVSQCVGECTAKFPEGTEWLRGHEKVTINGAAPLLRRCELTCNYGGQVTILLCGQPE